MPHELDLEFFVFSPLVMRKFAPFSRNLFVQQIDLKLKNTFTN